MLNSVIITLHNLSVDNLLKNKGELRSAFHEQFSFNDINDQFYIETYEWVFSNPYDTLHQIDDNYKITVLLQGLSESNDEQSILIRRAYKLLECNHSLEFHYQSNFDADLYDINRLIDNEQPSLYLIITDNVQSTDSSAFMSALLLANEPLYTKIPSLRVKSYILRPMKTNWDELPKAISQMHEIQPAFSHIKTLWCSQFNEKAVTDLKILFFEYGITLSEMDYPATFSLDNYFGYPNKALSYWLLLALTTQAATKLHQTQLVATTVLDKILFNVISPPNS